MIIIDTSDNNFYTIVPMHPLHKSSFGVSSTKILAQELFYAINKAKAKAKVEKLKETFCINCGEKLEQSSVFCGNWGKKVSNI